jgi:hypothetical protein
MRFENFLNDSILDENIVASNAEIQTFQSKEQAQQLIQQTRGVQVGQYIKSVSQTGEKDPSNSTANHDVFGQNQGEQNVGKLILKNNSLELVFVEKDESKNTFITIVNKQKSTIRMISIDYKGSQLLKRFLQ